MKLIENQYYIQNQKVLDICQKFDTPLYVYDGEKIVNQIQKLRQAFQGFPLQIKYAIKALSNISILKLVKTQGILR